VDFQEKSAELQNPQEGWVRNNPTQAKRRLERATQRFVDSKESAETGVLH
jgi:hypothetical protein